MRRTIILALTAASLAAPASAVAYSGDPWIDQYVEQIPTAGGPKLPGGQQRGGLSQAVVEQLDAAGGAQFASVTAASVPVGALAGKGAGRGPGSAGGKPAGSGSALPGDAQQPIAALASTITGDHGGLGAVFPAVIIGTVLGGLGLAAFRLRKRGL
jgi:hypothetical protein